MIGFLLFWVVVVWTGLQFRPRRAATWQRQWVTWGEPLRQRLATDARALARAIAARVGSRSAGRDLDTEWQEMMRRDKG